MAETSKKQDRKERLSQALRDNLRKRKQQKRDLKVQAKQARENDQDQDK